MTVVLHQGSILEANAGQSSEDAKMMTVTELARRVGVTPDAVRHYLRIGLLQPQRHPDNRYRLFSQGDAGRLYFIHQARMLGFSLKEIAEILVASERRDTSCPEVHRMIANKAERNRTRLVRLERLQVLLDTALKRWERRPGAVPYGRDVQALIESIGLERQH
ncbi:hypothetical protein Tel_11860 [Candidatus Tenderia electrophaga]|uniref:HTH merR-type domain-containing protein n=1 Tax=Candidatus Tenderia electrophaga TaxID=1748243 RepID=A0A0S2TF67_9GAMM|nr:hypothetical protein Tel_11860 [Candidatus Tenderia electrophaga]